ncbi:MAG: serine/threonine protein kinase [Lachnospiraceae bacterium]|nr:serine/threonine protein kinase [Lachnospiraceae bacterium]
MFQPLLIGGKYEIRKKLGSGGMSEVYLAVDSRLHMKWAVKRIDCRDPNRPFLADSVIAEANVLRSVRQENLVRIADIFKEGDYCYLVMDYVEGQVLSEVARRNPEYVKRHAILWAEQLLKALSILHKRKPPIIYRDMKPENIIVRPNGRVCLIDFGAAKRLINRGGRDDISLGTKGFAAPEQFTGLSDARSDIYALSKTLDSITEGLKMGGGWQRVIKKGMLENPKDRYQSTEEFLHALQGLKSMKVRLISGLITASLGLIAAGGISYGMQMERRERETADEYMRCVESGNEAAFRLEDEVAESYFTKAITEIDGGREEAYYGLLNVYRKKRRTEEGLNRLDSYFDNDYGGVRAMGGLIYECALTAFYELKDYSRAKAYFDKVPEGDYPAADYLAEISAFLSSFSTDPDKIFQILKDFRSYMKECGDIEVRARDSLLYAEACLIISDSLSGRNAGIVLSEGAERTKEVLEFTEKRQLKGEYREQSLDMLSAIYRLLGEKFPQNKKNYYMESLQYSEEFLSLKGKGRAGVKLLSMAGMYEELGSFKEAVKCYRRYEEEEPLMQRDAYLGYLHALSKEGNYGEMQRVYEKALSLNGVEEDIEFKKIMGTIERSVQ